jgi:iron complex transport system substrate-binding protein
MLASGTEIVYALGLGEQLVAISHECDFPPQALDKPRISRPRFDVAGKTSGEIDRAVRDAMKVHGTVYRLDEELLRDTAPDLILSQAVCAVCAVPTSLAEQAVALLVGGPRVLSLDVHRVDDILQAVLAVGEAAGCGPAAERYVASLRARITRVRDRVGDAQSVRVLAVEWLDPPFVPGHWVPEMIEFGGGVCLKGVTAMPSTEVMWEELSGLDPDVLLVMPCGYGLEASGREADRHDARLRQVAPRAVESGRAWVVDGSSHFNRSGPRVADGIDLVAALLHPDRFPEVDTTGRARRWS